MKYELDYQARGAVQGIEPAIQAIVEEQQDQGKTT